MTAREKLEAALDNLIAEQVDYAACDGTDDACVNRHIASVAAARAEVLRLFGHTGNWSEVAAVAAITYWEEQAPCPTCAGLEVATRCADCDRVLGYKGPVRSLDGVSVEDVRAVAYRVGVLVRKGDEQFRESDEVALLRSAARASRWGDVRMIAEYARTVIHDQREISSAGDRVVLTACARVLADLEGTP